MRNSDMLEGEDATVALCLDDAAVSVVEVKFFVEFAAGTRADLVRDSRLFWTAAIAVPLVSSSANGQRT